MLLVNIGLRKVELHQLQIRDIDLEQRAIVIHGKGGHVDRLPLSFEHVCNALALDVRDRDGAEHLLHPQRRETRPMDPSTVHRWFKKALERAGLPSTWTLHDLRRAAADALHDVTGNIALAQQLH
jgi:integrase